MNTLKGLNPRLSKLLRKKPLRILSSGPSLPLGILIDEELTPNYNSKHFYPAKPGEVLIDRYQTLVKIGWGVSSTVWLARDLQGEPEVVVALKIANTNSTSAEHEHIIEKHISTADPSQHGRSLMRTSLEKFEIKGPGGIHQCLVYSPLREPLSMYQKRFKGGKMPLPLAKTYIRALLTGLDYLHKESRIVHTDLKLENIMVSFEDPTVLAEFLDSQFETPMACKIDSTGRPVYQSHNDFGPLKSLGSIPQLVDFGLANGLRQDDDWGIWPIQPDHYRAPDVILGIGWQLNVIFGISESFQLWDMIEGKELFQHIHDSNGRYDAKLHLAEMIALLGPPHLAIIDRYLSMREFQYPEPVRREDGKLCATAEEYFCGPFFDNTGSFLYEDLIPNRRLEDTIVSLEGEEKAAFLDLVKRMLSWHPYERATAGNLAEHPFLQPKATPASDL